MLTRADFDRAAAEASYNEAIATAREQHALLLELRATTDLARFWGEAGQRDKAHDLLAPLYAGLTEGFDTPDLQEANELLDELA